VAPRELARRELHRHLHRRRRPGQRGGLAGACAQRPQPFQDWLRAKGVQGILIEYGAPDNDPRWLKVLEQFLLQMDRSSRQAGDTYWAGAPGGAATPSRWSPATGRIVSR
jgi:hypothetical protein